MSMLTPALQKAGATGVFAGGGTGDPSGPKACSLSESDSESLKEGSELLSDFKRRERCSGDMSRRVLWSCEGGMIDVESREERNTMWGERKFERRKAGSIRRISNKG